MGSGLGVYIHIPFCRTRCRYCDFYRVGESPGRRNLYLSALEAEIRDCGELVGARIETVFFGGGTPSLLAPDQVSRILDLLVREAALDSDCEISLEANPSDLDPDRLEGYRRAGITRLSLGVQSFTDRELTLLGRRHDAAAAERVFRYARAADFDNISLDLMLAIPGQTSASFRATLDRARKLAPEHFSLYLLEVHSSTEMDLLKRRRPGLFASEEVQRRRYLDSVETLGAAGYELYEISNFSLPDRRCRHNLRYWACEDYVGLGPAAHSLVAGRRWRNPPDLPGYLERGAERQDLPADLLEERVFLGLRRVEGVPWAWLEEASPLASGELRRRVERLGRFLRVGEGAVCLTDEGRVVSTAVIGELLATR